MKLFKAMVVALWSAVILVSCDTRDDLYYNDVRSGQYIIEVNGKRDTVIGYYNNGKGSVINRVYPRSFDENILNLRFDTTYVKASMLVRGVEYPLRFTDTYRDPKDVSDYVQITGNHHVTCKKIDDYTMMICTNIRLEDDITIFWEDTASRYLGYYIQGIYHEGLYGESFPDQLSGEYDDNHEEFKVLIEIMLWGPCPPTPVLEVFDIDGNPYEKRLSMAKSHDNDSEVKKYEFCIDGNVLPYRTADNRFDFVPGNWQSGKSAYGGDYITATERSEINYEFQTKGEHKIYYRCMDDFFVWSTWKCETIVIE